MLFSTAIFASAFAGLVAAASNHTVTVGAGGLHFTPNNLTADVGDMVTFVFMAKNHSVTQSSFKDPCTPLKGGFDSGYVATKPNATDFSAYTIMVTDAKPKWVFCAQANNVTGNHCHQGMVFSINATPDGTNTSAAAYVEKAKAFLASDPQLPSAAPAGSASASAASAGATDASGSPSGGASSSGSFLFPSGTNGAAAAGATPTDGSNSGSSSFLFPSSGSASATDSAASSGQSAAADQTSSASASGSSSAAPPAKSSGEKSVARRSMALLAAVGALVVLVL